MNRFFPIWRTTTVRLTAIFILIFTVFSIALLGYMAVRSFVAIQSAQTQEISWEIGQLRDLDRRRGMRAVAITIQRLADRPGPGIYFLGSPAGELIAGNLRTVPSNILSEEGRYTLNYSPQDAFGNAGVVRGVDAPRRNAGRAIVQSAVLENGMRLVVGRDVVERRGFAAIILSTLAFGVGGIIVLSVIAGGLTAMRVLARIDTITATSNKIMSGNLSERIPVTKRNDEFDQLASNLNDMLDRIEQLMQGLKEVTDNVAHDLKTPLTRMRNRAQSALRKDRNDADHRQALEKTIAESDQLISTFNALLLIARVESGSGSGAMDDVDVSEVVTDVAELYSPVVEDAGARLITIVEPGIRLRGNRELLSQALVNLLENAIKYALGSEPRSNDDDRSSCEIIMSVKPLADSVLIEVADQGPGIAKDDRNRVQERFVRLEKSRTEAGSGLGLSLVSAVVRLHKGSFEIEDNNPGVRAILKIPRLS